MPLEQKTILLSLESVGLFRQIQFGIAECREELPHWQFSFPHPSKPHQYEGEVGDGAIVTVQSADIENAWKSFTGPVINISHSLPTCDFPSIYSDDVRVGELAANYFLERDFRHFAYFGCDELRHSVERQRGYAQVLADKGLVSHSYRNPNGQNFFKELYSPPLDAWLRSLPKPCALFCNDDTHAFFLMEYAMTLGLETPADLAILGVNDELLKCRLAPWPISSIQLNGEEIGRRAALMLRDSLEGKSIQKDIDLVPPLGVVSRHSTDINGSRDPLTARAMQAIQRNLHRPFTVEELADSLHVSRRVLERNFRKHLDHSPYEGILRLRMRKAKQLLRDTDWTIQRISETCGFSETNQFYTQFRKREHQSPTDWRNSRAVS